MKRTRLTRVGIPAATIGAALVTTGWLGLSDDRAKNLTQLFVATAQAAPATGASVSAPARDTGPPAAAPAASGGRRAALAALDIGLVQQRVAPRTKTKDAFAAKSWVVAPPPAPPPPPPAPPPPPQAPPLPFKYMGMMQESADRTLFYLLHEERLIVAATNDVIAANYRIDGLEGGQLRFTYLPLDQRQTLTIGGSP